MIQPGRKYSATDAYRYGFNGKENDNDVKGEGNQQDYGMRIYDPRLGKFLSVDPISKDYPELTPYQFASNRPIDGIDLDGLEYLSYQSLYLLIRYYSDESLYVWDQKEKEKGNLVKNTPEEILRIRNWDIHKIIMNHPRNGTPEYDDSTPQVVMVEKQRNNKKGRAKEKKDTKAARRKMSGDIASGVIDLIKWDIETHYDKKHKEDLELGSASIGAVYQADKLGRAAFSHGTFPSVLKDNTQIMTDLVNFLVDGTPPTDGSFEYNNVIRTWGLLIFDNKEAVLNGTFDFRSEIEVLDITPAKVMNADGWKPAPDIIRKRKVGNPDPRVKAANDLIKEKPVPPGKKIKQG